MSIDRGLDKEGMVYKHDAVLAIKRNEIMRFSATWMDLEMTILSESDKDKYHMISFKGGI